jgi:hypothetical protein
MLAGRGQVAGPETRARSARLARRWPVRRRDSKPAPALATTMTSRLATMNGPIYGWSTRWPAMPEPALRPVAWIKRADEIGAKLVVV